MIRKMRNEDINRLEEIWYQESIRAHDWMDAPEDFWNRRRQRFKENTTNRADMKFVFEEHGVVLGFITGQQNHILELFVDHDHQRMNIGTELIKSLKEIYSNLKVNVYLLNHKAIKFYIKNNFVIMMLYAEKETGFAKFIMEWNKSSAFNE